MATGGDDALLRGELDPHLLAPTRPRVGDGDHRRVGGRPDYDLRYFAGTADPTDPADWIEEGET